MPSTRRDILRMGGAALTAVGVAALARRLPLRGSPRTRRARSTRGTRAPPSSAQHAEWSPEWPDLSIPESWRREFGLSLADVREDVCVGSCLRWLWGKRCDVRKSGRDSKVDDVEFLLVARADHVEGLAVRLGSGNQEASRAGRGIAWRYSGASGGSIEHEDAPHATKRRVDPVPCLVPTERLRGCDGYPESTTTVLAATVGPLLTLRVAFVHDVDSLRVFGGSRAHLRAGSELALGTAQRALQESRLGINLVHAGSFPWVLAFQGTAKHFAARPRALRLDDIWTQLLREDEVADASGAPVVPGIERSRLRSLRRHVAADVIVFVAGRGRGRDHGQAALPVGLRGRPAEAERRCVVRADDLRHGDLTLAHELGHLLGCGHDPGGAIGTVMSRGARRRLPTFLRSDCDPRAALMRCYTQRLLRA